MLLITGIVLLLLLPAPWGLVVFLAALLLWIGEVYGIWRVVRKRKVQAGAETLVGRSAVVTARCMPLGQVRLAGESEIWSARCADGAERGETVRVVGLDGLTLIVER
jgi:membrane-bound serine protease (ClpP class)